MNRKQKRINRTPRYLLGKDVFDDVVRTGVPETTIPAKVDREILCCTGNCYIIFFGPVVHLFIEEDMYVECIFRLCR